jgi:hypothetical protein
MAHKRETVFGAKADKKEKSAAVITPLTDKDLKTVKGEAAANESEEDAKKLDAKKAEAGAILKDEKACDSEKKAAAKDLAKAEGDAKDKANIKDGEAKIAKRQEKYEAKVAVEDKAAAATEKKKLEKADQKKAADQAAFSVDLADSKTPATKKPLSSDETWASADLGGNLSLA